MQQRVPDLTAFMVGAMIVGFLILAVLVAYILFLINLSKTVNQVAPPLRKITPGQVWLLLIPVFGSIWLFILAGKVADSLAAEYRRRGIPLTDDRPTYQLGVWYAIMAVGSYIRNIGVGRGQDALLFVFLGSICALFSFVLWIVYWVKTANHKNELKRSGPWENFAHLDAMGPNGYPQPWQQQAQQQPWQPHAPEPQPPLN